MLHPEKAAYTGMLPVFVEKKCHSSSYLCNFLLRARNPFSEYIRLNDHTVHILALPHQFNTPSNPAAKTLNFC